MFYICDKNQQGNFGVRDTSDGVVEFYTKASLAKVHQQSGVKILGMRYDYVKNQYKFSVVKLPYLQSFDSLVNKFVFWLRHFNVEICTCDFESNEIELLWQVRFLGGESAWSGADEDICDADVLDKRVAKAVTSACQSFTAETGVNVFWCTGEKAWTYFDFC